MEVPWVEKYRPQTLDEVVGNEEAIQRLKAICVDGNLPHLILSGPPGSGKTTSIMCLARALLAPTAPAAPSVLREAVLELNASDDRGIQVVRTKIKQFAQKKVTLPEGRHKIVVLDEADSMTKEAQQALRRIMELYASTTRFALACNLSNKIIEPIQSRCAILRYGRLSDEQVLKRLVQVVELEKVPYDPKGLAAIVECSDGDMRNALNILQSAHTGFGLVNAENVFHIADQPHPALVEHIIELLRKGSLDDAVAHLSSLIGMGYSAVDIVQVFFRVVRGSTTLPDEDKLRYLKEIGTVHMRMVAGLATAVQCFGLLGRLHGCGSAPKS